MDKLQISLAAARVNANMTQADIAEKMHLNKQTIVNWENNRVIPKPAQLEMMSRIYNIPVDNIFLPTKSTLSWKKGKEHVENIFYLQRQE